MRSGIRVRLQLLMLPLLLWHSASGSFYHPRHGFLCIRPEYQTTVSGVTSDILCADLCNNDQRCQAFSLADGPCQLFVFDKCSKSVKDCGCSRRGRVFVKQQPGLEPGALCPSGFAMDLCGVKYKALLTRAPWTTQRQACESSSGLVIMADVTSSAEMSHIGQLYSVHNFSGGHSMWLSGLQAAGSVEPDEGWSWVTCSITVNASFWGSSEPNDNGGIEDAIFGRMQLGDASKTNLRGGLCECLSPFD